MAREPRRKRQSLDEVLAYRNREVIARFMGEWEVTRAEANRLFDDLKRYLWLATQPGCGQLRPVPIIDEMWHTFLVFTADYAAWTTRAFGAVALHRPLTTQEKRAIQRLWRRAPERARREARQRLLDELALVYDKLGERVVLRWYVTYATSYGGGFFAQRRRPAQVPVWELPEGLRRRAGLAAAGPGPGPGPGPGQ